MELECALSVLTRVVCINMSRPFRSGDARVSVWAHNAAMWPVSTAPGRPITIPASYELGVKLLLGRNSHVRMTAPDMLEVTWVVRHPRNSPQDISEMRYNVDCPATPLAFCPAASRHMLSPQK